MKTPCKLLTIKLWKKLHTPNGRGWAKSSDVIIITILVGEHNTSLPEGNEPCGFGAIQVHSVYEYMPLVTRVFCEVGDCLLGIIHCTWNYTCSRFVFGLCPEGCVSQVADIFVELNAIQLCMWSAVHSAPHSGHTKIFQQHHLSFSATHLSSSAQDPYQ